MKQKKIGVLYLVMHDADDGPQPSRDSGNPFRTMRAAVNARNALGESKKRNYYVVRFRAERIVRGKPLA